MSRQGVDCNDSRIKHDKHLRKVSEKRDVVHKTKLLLDVWEYENERTDGKYHDYVLHLRAKLRAKENQLNNMRPITDDEQL